MRVRMGRVVIGRYLRGSVEVLSALAMRPVRPRLRAGGSEFWRALLKRSWYRGYRTGARTFTPRASRPSGPELLFLVLLMAASTSSLSSVLSKERVMGSESGGMAPAAVPSWAAGLCRMLLHAATVAWSVEVWARSVCAWFSPLFLVAEEGRGVSLCDALDGGKSGLGNGLDLRPS